MNNNLKLNCVCIVSWTCEETSLRITWIMGNCTIQVRRRRPRSAIRRSLQGLASTFGTEFVSRDIAVNLVLNLLELHI
jgi:hypothetical protein